ncbi:MAG: spore germination protein, partial [Bacilli bacterium]|nr:spore germination protein [Bacilli bacterium]
ILVITVAVTALASFTLPNYNFGFAVRAVRFLFIVAASLYGFYGICLGLLAFTLHLVSLKSFGVPILMPSSPGRHTVADMIWQQPVFEVDTRHYALRPLRKYLQKKIVRAWDVRNKKRLEEDES